MSWLRNTIAYTNRRTYILIQKIKTITLTLNMIFTCIRLFQTRNNIRRSLACSILRSGQNIAVLQNDRNSLFLHRRGFLEPLFENSHEQFSLEKEIFKVTTFGLGHIFCLVPFIFFRSDEAIFVGSGARDDLFGL